MLPGFTTCPGQRSIHILTASYQGSLAAPAFRTDAVWGKVSESQVVAHRFPPF